MAPVEPKPEPSKSKKISEANKKVVCCPRFHCGKEQDHGYIQGEDYELKKEELEPPTTYFHNALYTRKAINGTKTAVDFYDRILTFDQLSTFSTALALQLTERVPLDESAAPSGDVIFAVCLPPSEKFIVILFAILKTGAAYLPLDPQYPDGVLLGILTRFSPKVLITDESGPILCKYNSEDFSDICTIISVEELWLSIDVPAEHPSRRGSMGFAAKLVKRRPSMLRREPRPYSFIINSAPSTKERLAVVIHNTRLISDNPQGVRISHMNIMNRLSWGWRNLPFAKNGNCCLTVPVSSCESILQIFGPLLQGITLHILTKRDMKMMGYFIHVIGDKQITRICLSPEVLHDFINECSTFKLSELKSILEHLKYVLCRGRIVQRDSVVQFLNIFPSGKLLCCLYGHPELTNDVICEKFKGLGDVKDRTIDERLAVGNSLPNTRIYVLDSDLKQVGEGEEGQICVSGLPVVLGYVDESEDAKSFVPNSLNADENPNFNRLFCTGDYGRMVRCKGKQRRLLIDRRTDNLIHHQGHDFIMDDVKKTLLTTEEIEQVHVQLIHPGNYDETVVAFAVLKKQFKDATLLGEMDFQLRSKLPEFMIPEFVFIDDIPKTGNGQVDTDKLQHKYETGRDSS